MDAVIIDVDEFKKNLHFKTMKRKQVKLKSTPQVKRFNRVLKRTSGIKHVVKHENGWVVKSSGSIKAAKVFDKQSAAIGKARDMAKRSNGSVVVHRSDGKIRKVIR